MSDFPTPEEFASALLEPFDAGARVWVLEDRRGNPGDWTGRTAKPSSLVDLDPKKNYWISTAAYPKGAPSREMEHMLGVAAIVIDDPTTKGDAAKLFKTLGRPTARVRTSEESWHWWYFLKEPAELAQVRPVLSRIKALGLGDSSGNNANRYARLPFGVNNKREHKGAVFRVRGVEWTARRFDIDRIAEALNVTAEQKSAAESGCPMNSELTDDELRAQVVTNKSYHDAVMVLAARMIARGDDPSDVTDELRELMESCPKKTRRHDSWRTTYDEIETRLVATAVTKFTPRIGRADTKSSFTPVNGVKVDDDDLGLIMFRADEIEPEPIDWLWLHRFARSKLAMIAGHPGVGKSQATCDIVARITNGSAWPISDEGEAPEGDVIMLSAEDAAADTIVPRLMAAGAVMSKVRLVQAVRDTSNKTDSGIEERNFDLMRDIPRLEQAVAALKKEGRRVVMVVIDPITAYGGVGKLNWDKAGDVRGFLKPLADFAEEHGVAVVLVHHLRKSGSSGEALHAVLGSVGMGAAIRTASFVMRDSENSDDSDAEDAEPKNRVLFLHGKSNIGPWMPAIPYSIETVTVKNSKGEKIPTSRVAWEKNTVNKDANDMMRAANSGTQHKRQDAVKWLRDRLADGPVLASDMESAAAAAGYTESTIKRAKKEAKVISKKEEKYQGRWAWKIIGVDDAKGAHADE